MTKVSIPGETCVTESDTSSEEAYFSLRATETDASSEKETVRVSETQSESESKKDGLSDKASTNVDKYEHVSSRSSGSLSYDLLMARHEQGISVEKPVSIGAIFKLFKPETITSELESLLTLHESRPCLFLAVDQFARVGNLDAIKWLVLNVSDFGFMHARRELRDLLAIVERLKTNEDRTRFTQVWGHRNNISLVEYVDLLMNVEDMFRLYFDFERNDEFCTFFAMEVAAQNGHLDVLKWLFQNATFLQRPTDNLIHVLDSDKQKIGYDAKSPKLCQISTNDKLLEIAAAYYQLPVLCWLLYDNKQRAKVTLKCVQNIICHGNSLEFELLYHTMAEDNPPTRNTIVSLLLQIISDSNDNLEMFEFLYYKVVGPISEEIYFTLIDQAINVWGCMKIGKWIIDKNPQFHVLNEKTASTKFNRDVAESIKSFIP